MIYWVVWPGGSQKAAGPRYHLKWDLECVGDVAVPGGPGKQATNLAWHRREGKGTRNSNI